MVSFRLALIVYAFTKICKRDSPNLRSTGHRLCTSTEKKRLYRVILNKKEDSSVLPLLNYVQGAMVC